MLLNPANARGVGAYEWLPYVLEDCSCISAVDMLPASPDGPVCKSRDPCDRTGPQTSLHLQREPRWPRGEDEPAWGCLAAFAAGTQCPSLSPIQCQAHMSPQRGIPPFHSLLHMCGVLFQQGGDRKQMSSQNPT